MPGRTPQLLTTLAVRNDRIRRLYAEGETILRLATSYDISRQRVQQVVSGEPRNRVTISRPIYNAFHARAIELGYPRGADLIRETLRLIIADDLWSALDLTPYEGKGPTK